MKTRIFATLSSFALLTAAAAFAQNGVPMKVDIPFEFRVANTIMPAGSYDVRVQLASGLVSLQSMERNAAAMILTNGVGGGRDIPEKSSLVFHRYGNTYFLSRVWSHGYAIGRELPTSKAERELAANGSTVPPVKILARK
jgi:hypothetical protein